MTKYKLLFFFLISPFIPCVSQSRHTSDKVKVQTAVTNVFQALADRDFGKMKANCTADFTVLENGITWNLDTLQQKINISKTIPDFKRINTIGFIDTRIKGKVAWVSYNNQAEVTRNGQKGFVQWLESAILVKEGKTWKIQLLHSTLIKRS